MVENSVVVVSAELIGVRAEVPTRIILMMMI